MLNALKSIGFLIAAVAVITVLASGGAFIVIVGVIGGVLISFISAIVMIAASLKDYFETPRSKKQ